MTIDCTQLDDLLFDGGELAMTTAANHAAHCAECAARLASWDDISSTAKSMRHEWDSDLLWPRIERSLAAQTRPASRRWFRQAIAASLLTVAIGGTGWFALRLQRNDAAYDATILRLSALDEVERAEQAHLAAIENLERVAETTLENAPSPLIVSYKEKLMLLDDAIAECEANIERNRQNAHLRTQLLAMYSEKQETLRAVVREDIHVSTP